MAALAESSDSQYLDSQLIIPGAAYTLDIVYNGSGNRNLTVGDSIFHCHFYPHFAQGMWSLWRSHDVFEAGTRLDNDGRPVTRVTSCDGKDRPGLPRTRRTGEHSFYYDDKKNPHDRRPGRGPGLEPRLARRRDRGGHADPRDRPAAEPGRCHSCRRRCG